MTILVTIHNTLNLVISCVFSNLPLLSNKVKHINIIDILIIRNEKSLNGIKL